MSANWVGDWARRNKRLKGEDPDLDLEFHTGEARLVKRPGERANLERNTTRRWVGAVKPDQGREP